MKSLYADGKDSPSKQTAAEPTPREVRLPESLYDSGNGGKGSATYRVDTSLSAPGAQYHARQDRLSSDGGDMSPALAHSWFRYEAVLPF